ncbi:hypothetical protein [Pseudonocardia sp. D17]|uniref:hypothetical protein n=1 Tax=Pseudonocardia sp. D17 TaxID=882661 RepID=UPI002B3AA2E8|nr:hypothetical protein PSD17_63460 [Pseudonocardia sp. D17]
MHTALTRRLIGALRFMDPVPRQQAIYSLLDNLETLAPVMPQVMLATRSALDDIDDIDFTTSVHARIRALIQDKSYIAKIDLNLSYMVRALASRYSLENEHLLIELFQSTHGFTNSQSIPIQRDIMMILANWQRRYWLSDIKHTFSTMHPWLKRAFLMSSYSLDDEGRHWRNSVKSSLGDYEKIVHEWAGSKAQNNGWRIPV